MSNISIYFVTNFPAITISISDTKIFPLVVSVDRPTMGILSGGSEVTEIILDCCGDLQPSSDGYGSTV